MLNELYNFMYNSIDLLANAGDSKIYMDDVKLRNGAHLNR